MVSRHTNERGDDDAFDVTSELGEEWYIERLLMRLLMIQYRRRY